MSQTVEVVRHLPQVPQQGRTYSFARLTRDDVTYGSHGLHKYPAKFIPQFPRWGLSYDPDTPSRVVLDPFCGSGTTMVEAGVTGSHAIGCDISPLAVLISQAKCSTGAAAWDHVGHCESVVRAARALAPKYQKELSANQGESCLGMHFTWANWFRAEELARLIALRDAIRDQDCSADLKTFSLALLSSIVKSCSYLNEDQIKVRYDHEKQLADPLVAFQSAMATGASAQTKLAKTFLEAGASFETTQASASALPVETGTVDRIITSPPYINAVDYTMAHKYNLYVLGLLEPEAFKDHCREYIGVTERAVRSSDLLAIPNLQGSRAQLSIDALLALDTPTARNRAYVVAQYFSGMQASFAEAYRVLKAGGLYVFVVGEANRICGLQVPTSAILKEQAESVGFDVEVDIFHELANRSSMRLSRSSTGGTIGREQVYVFRK